MGSAWIRAAVWRKAPFSELQRATSVPVVSTDRIGFRAQRLGPGLFSLGILSGILVYMYAWKSLGDLQLWHMHYFLRHSSYILFGSPPCGPSHVPKLPLPIMWSTIIYWEYLFWGELQYYSSLHAQLSSIRNPNEGVPWNRKSYTVPMSMTGLPTPR